jgi:chemotaxis protein CheZ
MNMNELPSTTPATSPEVFQQLGLITRQLHDTLNQLGVMPKLQHAVDGLPDARSRLSYIARKTGEAADKVLNAVDLAKLEQTGITAAARQLAAIDLAAADPAAAEPAATRLAGQIEAHAARTDAILTDIMLAQDFHDLTGQVVTAVVALAIELEDSLVKLLLQAAPTELGSRHETNVLPGPVVDATGRPDVVTNQGEVDDLLASLGF